MTIRTYFIRLLMVLLLSTPTALHAAAATAGIPIRVTLSKASYVTLIIEDAQGRRIRNLLADTRLPGGESVVTWDGYDEGERDKDGNIVRRRAEPGTYRLRGLTHGGIRMLYEFSVYSPGTPAWFTLDNTGAWLCDHTPPADILFLPKGSAAPHLANGGLLVNSNVSESGQSLMWLDMDGRKQWGAKIGWMGGKALAQDTGPQRVADYYAYTLYLNAGHQGTMHLHGLKADGETTEICAFKVDGTIKVDGWRSGACVAVHNGLAVISNDVDDRLLFVDVAAKRITGSVPMPKARGIAFNRDGRLLVLSEERLKSYATKSAEGEVSLTDEKTLIAAGLEDPRRVLVAGDGSYYISEWGRWHQVRVFSRSGKLLRVIGHAGGPQLGRYDEQRMQHPLGLALDSRGRLWVCEDEFLPKRISVWNAADGRFLRAFYGGPQYGGGGMIDPRDRTRFYYASSFNYGSYGLMEFHLDWQTGTGKLAYICYRGPEPTDKISFWDQMYGDNDYKPWEQWASYTHPEDMDALRGAPPERAVYIGGRQYMVNAFNGPGGLNEGSGIWMMDGNHLLQPVAMLGGADLLDVRWHAYAPYVRNLADLRALWKDKRMRQTLLVWSDRNHDHHMQANEVQTADVNLVEKDGRQYGDFDGDTEFTGPDLSLTSVWGIHLPVPAFDSAGVPIYDMAQRRFLAPVRERGVPVPANGGWFLNLGWGWDMVRQPIRGYRNGVEKWRYQIYPGTIVPQYPGQLVEFGRLMGPPLTPRAGQTGEFIALGGNKGNIALLTTDGLLVQILGGDMRQAPLWRMKSLQRGQELKGVSFEDEHFHPTINQTADGSLYLVAGKEHSSVLRLEGWETVARRDFGSVQVTDTALAGLPETRIVLLPRTARKRLTGVLMSQPPQIGSGLSDLKLPASAWATIDERASGALAICGDRLYALYRTGDSDLLSNAGGDWRFLFKSGGALDLLLGTSYGAKRERQEPVAGDLRLLVTRVQGRTRAILYRQVAPAAPPAARTLFNSPVGAVTFDSVEDVSDQLELTQSGGDYIVAVPLKTLGLTPQTGRALLADMGLIRGNGRQNTQRIYWNNLDTAIVSDIPSEARLQPGKWGEVEFQPLPAAEP